MTPMLPPEDITAALLRERLALTAFISSVTRDFHLAEDIFQDVCVKAVSKPNDFESPQHLLNWARLTGRHRAIDVLRVRDGKIIGLSEEMLAALEPVWPEGEAAQGSPALEALRKCLQRLTPNNREIVRLRYFEGRGGAQVAEALGRKLETVYQALARIHKSLADCVRQRLASDPA
jgi:RNA polymerase sigma-70 factor (ECF subfamily)